MRVCLGGTFDCFHVGHERLLAKAFEVGDEVFVGVTSQRLATRHRTRPIRPFAERKRAVERFLRRQGWKATVSEIDHPFGRSTDPAYQVIVVSPETEARTRAINAERRRRGYKPLRVVTVPFSYGEDGRRISATRIATGDIDARGRRRVPLRVAVGTRNELKARAVVDAFRRAFPRLRLRVRRLGVSSRVPEQPRDGQTYRGARARAERALKTWPAADYGVGVEAGLLRNPHFRRYTDVQYCVILDADGGHSEAHGGGFYYPDFVTREALTGRTISELLGPRAGDRRIGSTIGAVGYLSKGALDRRELTMQAVLLALVPRIRRDLYEE